MTRINVVDPKELCDQHLLAEHRELTRIPNAVAKSLLNGKFNIDNQSPDYKLGVGHVKFFYNKMLFLKKRYESLHNECLARGFNVQNRWNYNLPKDADIWHDYEISDEAIKINKERINERMPQKPRFTKS